MSYLTRSRGAFRLQIYFGSLPIHTSKSLTEYTHLQLIAANGSLYIKATQLKADEDGVVWSVYVRAQPVRHDVTM